MRQLIREQVERRFAVAAVEESPFPHVIIPDFFPTGIYRELIKQNPFAHSPGSPWGSEARRNEVTSRTPYHTRRQIDLKQGAESPDAAQNGIWREVRAAFLDDDWFLRLIISKYPTYFRIRFGDLIDEPHFEDFLQKELFLQKHEPGFAIGPHTDVPTRVLTCIFSFAENDEFSEYGTELLRPTDPLNRCWGCDHYERPGFDVAKVAPYLPNSFLMFFKTRHSFHSVPAIPDRLPGQRYGMQFQLYEPHGGLFRDLSRPDLMEVRWPGKTRPSLVHRLLEAARSIAG